MFTGIIKHAGRVKEVISNGSNKTTRIGSGLSSGFKVDQSVSHSGVCMTIEEVSGNRHRITAIDETFQKTNLDDWQPESLINPERYLWLNDRLDGHIVHGHVDATGS